MESDGLVQFLMGVRAERLEQLSAEKCVFILAFSEKFGQFGASSLVETVHHGADLLLLFLDLFEVVFAAFSGGLSWEN